MRATVAALAFSLALVACGSGTTASHLAVGDGSPSAPASGGWTGYSPGKATAPATKPAKTSPRAATSSPAGSPHGGRVALGRSCVHRGEGSEPQTLAVSAGPGETVTYSTYYSDYSSELDRPDYTTGHGYGTAGADGFYHARWTVPATATPGRATVRVTATDMSEDAQEASFTVVKQGERCP
jgi:hypothetical protein